MQTALNELDVIRQEATEQGWDGCGGRPLDPNAYEKARAFLEALPTTVPEPEIGIDSDG